jgi:hypothetical protein
MAFEFTDAVELVCFQRVAAICALGVVGVDIKKAGAR